MLKMRKLCDKFLAGQIVKVDRNLKNNRSVCEVPL